MNEFMLCFEGTTWTFIDACVTTVTMILVFYGFYQNRVQSKKIDLCFLLNDGGEICIQTHLLRKYVTRAEVSGVLGFFRKDMDKNHKIAYLSSEQYLKDIYEIQNGKKSKLLIKVTPQELEQFNI